MKQKRKYRLNQHFLKNTISEKQMAMLEALKDREPVPDEDIPDLTDEELSQFRRVSEIKK